MAKLILDCARLTQINYKEREKFRKYLQNKFALQSNKVFLNFRKKERAIFFFIFNIFCSKILAINFVINNKTKL